MKLKYCKGGQSHLIDLSPIKPEGKALTVRHRGRACYVPLVPPDDSSASDIKIFSGGKSAVAKVERDLSSMLTYDKAHTAVGNGRNH